MKLITYFGLTLISILIQFSVMEFIQENFEIDNEVPIKIDLNVTSQNKNIKKDNTQKPHALYYRTHESNKEERDSASEPIYSNSSLPRTILDTTTDVTTTIVDDIYDENTSVAVTTDDAYSTTEFDNFTEISFFDKKNQTNIKPNTTPKRAFNNDCGCNFLYKICDINCCCDIDCSDVDLKMFKSCDDVIESTYNQNAYSCELDSPNKYLQYGIKHFESWFCISKSNLPEKRNVNSKKYDLSAAERSFKWHQDIKDKYPNEFKRKPYAYGDHVWVLQNGSIRYIDLPAPEFNSYCTGRKSLTFLIEETIECSVKLKDLEMFQILKASEEATLVSVVGNSLKPIANLNCSTLHCTNWTIVICDGLTCGNYNKSIHEPYCTETACTNLALKFDYIFYYHDSKIINATIKLYIQKVMNIVPFMLQEINVKFIITNDTTSEVLKTSGNPGYLNGLPVIASFSNDNHTESFYNNTLHEKYLSYPSNLNGNCKSSNVSTNYITFGINKRVKCRFQYVNKTHPSKETELCKNINDKIIKFIGVNRKVFISPLGNPTDIKDDDWVPLQHNLLEEPVYGEYNERHSKLHCYNLRTRISYIFIFADISEKIIKKKIKILSADMVLNVQNVTFNVEDISTVLTFDTMFIDGTKPSVYEYAGGPQLNINLPKDFFFPFSNRCNSCVSNYLLLIILMQCLFIYRQIK